MSQTILLPPGEGRAVRVADGARLRIVNTEGGQVVDTWAFSTANPQELLSMEHSRSAIYSLLFGPGDVLVSNAFRPMLEIAEDTSPGIHDTLHAACSRESYRFYGVEPPAMACEDNLRAVLAGEGIAWPGPVPCPWNLFEHAPVVEGMKLIDEPSAALAGDYVELIARMDLLVVCSACPSTVGDISGSVPHGAAIELL
jgi:uncharacterized protein